MSENISAAEVAKLLVGKTIKEVKLCEHQGKHLGVEELVFTGGSVVSLTGSGDEAHVFHYSTQNGVDGFVIHDEAD